LLESLHHQTFKDWDLFIVDDCSDPPVNQNKQVMEWLMFLQRHGHSVTVIRNPVRLMICKSRNEAIKADTTHEWCARIDDDSYADPEFFERLWGIAHGHLNAKQMEKGIRPEVAEIPLDKIGGVGGIVPYLARVPYYLNSKKIKVFNKVECDDNGNITKCEDDGHYHWHPSAILPSHHLRSSFLFRRQAVVDAGMHVENLGSTGFREETLLCLRMMEKGWKLVTDTEAKLWHMPAMGEGRDWGGRKDEDLVANNEAYFKKVTPPLLLKLKEMKAI